MFTQFRKVLKAPSKGVRPRGHLIRGDNPQIGQPKQFPPESRHSLRTISNSARAAYGGEPWVTYHIKTAFCIINVKILKLENEMEGCTPNSKCKVRHALAVQYTGRRESHKQ